MVEVAVVPECPVPDLSFMGMGEADKLTVDQLRKEYTIMREALFEIAQGKLGRGATTNLAYTTLEHGRATCHDCIDKYACEFAWDSYNTNGDCLASK